MPTVDDLLPGDWIVIDRPCRVRVTRVVPVEGNTLRGNREIHFTDAKAVDDRGIVFLGSQVNVEPSP